MADRHEAAVKAAATRKARGEKTGFSMLSTAVRSSNAHKAAATRRARGIKTGFSRWSTAERSAAAHKAAATRRAKGEKPFATMTHEQRVTAARKAAATRQLRHPKRLSSHVKRPTLASHRAYYGHRLPNTLKADAIAWRTGKHNSRVHRGVF